MVVQASTKDDAGKSVFELEKLKRKLEEEVVGYRENVSFSLFFLRFFLYMDGFL